LKSNYLTCATNGSKIFMRHQHCYLLSTATVSAITEIELYCWKTSDEKDMDVLHNFINDALVIELERPIKLKTADIRKQHKIKLPDAIIAATAIVYDLTLITHNISDFKNILDLQVIDLHRL